MNLLHSSINHSDDRNRPEGFDDESIRTADEDRRLDRDRRSKRLKGKERDKAKARFNRDW